MKVRFLIFFGLFTLFFVNAYAQTPCYTIDTSRPEWPTGCFIRGECSIINNVKSSCVERYNQCYAE